MPLSIPQVLDVLKGLIDPDVGINVVDLGLIEGVEVCASEIRVGLIMTTPACPQTSYLRDEATQLLRQSSGTRVEVEILDAPLWSPDRLSDSARASLGWPG